jgi:hypothetical protein
MPQGEPVKPTAGWRAEPRSRRDARTGGPSPTCTEGGAVLTGGGLLEASPPRPSSSTIGRAFGPMNRPIRPGTTHAAPRAMPQCQALATSTALRTREPFGRNPTHGSVLVSGVLSLPTGRRRRRHVPMGPALPHRFADRAPGAMLGGSSPGRSPPCAIATRTQTTLSRSGDETSPYGCTAMLFCDWVTEIVAPSDAPDTIVLSGLVT